MPTVIKIKGKKPDLPKSLEWYLDAAKWIAAISTGAIVFAFNLFKDFELHGILDKGLFLVIAASLGLASIASIATFFYITSYANGKESLSPDSKLKQKEQEDLNRLYKSLVKAYYAMLFSFISGILFFSVYFTKAILIKDSKNKIESNVKISPFNNDNDFLIHDTKSDEKWLIIRDSLGYHLEHLNKN